MYQTNKLSLSKRKCSLPYICSGCFPCLQFSHVGNFAPYQCWNLMCSSQGYEFTYGLVLFMFFVSIYIYIYTYIKYIHVKNIHLLTTLVQSHLQFYTFTFLLPINALFSSLVVLHLITFIWQLCCENMVSKQHVYLAYFFYKLHMFIES